MKTKAALVHTSRCGLIPVLFCTWIKLISSLVIMLLLLKRFVESTALGTAWLIDFSRCCCYVLDGNRQLPSDLSALFRLISSFFRLRLEHGFFFLQFSLESNCFLRNFCVPDELITLCCFMCCLWIHPCSPLLRQCNGRGYKSVVSCLTLWKIEEKLIVITGS